MIIAPKIIQTLHKLDVEPLLTGTKLYGRSVSKKKEAHLIAPSLARRIGRRKNKSKRVYTVLRWITVVNYYRNNLKKTYIQ